jgi:hypothetical protein
MVPILSAFGPLTLIYVHSFAIVLLAVFGPQLSASFIAKDALELWAIGPTSS